MFAPVLLHIEELRYMDVAQHIVDILLENHNLRQARGDELSYKVLTRYMVYTYGHYLVAGYHALPHLGVFEIYRIAEYLDLILYHVAVGRVMQLFLQVIVKLLYSELIRRCLGRSVLTVTSRISRSAAGSTVRTSTACIAFSCSSV